jgi:filamentous hemagglutinin
LKQGFKKAMDNSRVATPKGRGLSTHANIDSLRRHGFRGLSEVDDVIDNPTRVIPQRDGATVYIQRVGRQRRRYHIVIVGDRGIVTGMRNIEPRELRRLGKKYGFDSNP